jgi:hypothetical protein
MSVTIADIQDKAKMSPTPGEHETVEANQQSRPIILHQAIERKSRRQSLALATAILQILPREIRDLIWEAYLRENPIDFYRVCYNTYWNSASFRKFSYLPHFLLPEYSGMETVREVGQIAYKIGKFDLRELVGVLQLQHILEYDHLNLGLVPRDYICNLTIMMDTTDMPEKRGTLGYPITKRKDLPANLNSLLDVRLKKNLSLHINFSQRNSALDVAEILHIFLPVWIELRERKANVKVQYKRSIKSQKEPFVFDLSGLLEYPKGEWRWRILDMCTGLGLLTARERRWTERKWQKTINEPVN